MAEGAAKGSRTPADVWEVLVQVHNHHKDVFLLAEEFDPTFNTFFQPRTELQHALEHIVRAKGAELGLTRTGTEPVSDYVLKSMDKALGHEYRGFFDTADWLSVTIRGRILESLKGHSNEALQAVLPDYYSALRPRVNQICGDIARVRAEKDISCDAEVLPEVAQYRAVLDELLAINDRIVAALPALSEWRNKYLRSLLIRWLARGFAGGVAVSALTAWVLKLLGLL